MNDLLTALPFPSADWMSSMDGSRKLHTFSLPGSHDTCAYTVNDSLARTQDATLEAQLQAGVRVIDIRCRHENDTFAIYHAGISLDMTFDHVIDICGRFLAGHPRECIVMSIKEEWAAKACSRSFVQTFDGYVSENVGVRWHLSPIAPTLEAARGSIVLLRRFASERPLGIDLTAWPDNSTFVIDDAPTRFAIQDEFRVPIRASIEYKWRAVETMLDTAPDAMPTRWAINFCSGTGMSAPPHWVAFGDDEVAGIHTRLDRRLAARNQACGTVMLDFCDWADWALVRRLIACNVERAA
ncbi:phosphatidylinositol-specific phospholipase C [Trinickia sp. NRRL B-1857]|uniref:phosphatidylinositol-specific phospholipase C n=1 Tax=Trinickia sp. NRRL B-1857 TaxID=3162879 RepID=UPI003D2B7156